MIEIKRILFLTMKNLWILARNVSDNQYSKQFMISKVTNELVMMSLKLIALKQNN